MHRSLNSTEVLSKTYSRIKMGSSGLKMSTSILQSKSPKAKSKPATRPQSSHKHKIILKEQAMVTNLHEALIAKNKKLNVMIKNIYGFAVCLEDIDWIINEAESIIKDYIHSIEGKGRTPHRIQIQNIHSQMVKLIQRFTGMEKEDFSRIFPQKNSKVLSENHNILNTRQPDTICSFKCTDMDLTENQEDVMPADFSKIKLPSVIKESASMENINSSRYENQIKTKQFESTIQVLRDELERQRQMKNELKNRYEEEIKMLNKRLERDMVEWQSYKNYASATIRKCKQYLQHLGGNNGEQSEEIERLLDDLFSWENTIDGNVLEEENQAVLNMKKRAMLEELSDLEWRVKQSRAQIEKLQSLKTKASSKYNTARTKSEVVIEDPNQDIVKMLYVQASTIEHLI